MYSSTDSQDALLINGTFGFSLNPVKAIKKGVKSVVHASLHPIDTTKSVAKTGLKVTKAVAKSPVGKVAAFTIAPVVAAATFASKKVFHLATTPLRNKVHSLRDGRARKLAQIRRGSNVPNAAEKREAVSWTKSKLKSGGPQGYLLMLFAGAPEVGSFGVVGGDDAAILAAIPILAMIVTAVLKKALASGEIATVATNVAQNYAQQKNYIPSGPDVQSYEQPVEEIAYDAESSEEMSGAFVADHPKAASWMIAASGVVAGLGLYFTFKR